MTSPDQHSADQHSAARRAQLLQDLSAWLARPAGQTLEEFISARAGAGGLEALGAIDEAARAYHELREAREQEGVSREAWVARALKPVVTVDADTGDVSLPFGDGRLSADTAAGLAGKLTRLVAGGVELAEDAAVGAGTGAEVSAAVGAAVGAKMNAEAGADVGVAVGAALHTLQGAAPAPVQAFLTSYFEAPERAPVEREVTGVVAGSLVRASQALPAAERVAPVVLGLAADAGLFRAKTSFLVGADLLSPERAVERVVDRAASHVVTAVKTAARELGGHVGQVAGAWLGGLVGMAPVGAALGRVVGELAGAKVAAVVEKGVRAVASGVKAVVGSVVSAGKSLLKSAGRGIARLFGW